MSKGLVPSLMYLLNNMGIFVRGYNLLINAHEEHWLGDLEHALLDFTSFEMVWGALLRVTKQANIARALFAPGTLANLEGVTRGTAAVDCGSQCNIRYTWEGGKSSPSPQSLPGSPPVHRDLLTLCYMSRSGNGKCMEEELEFARE